MKQLFLAIVLLATTAFGVIAQTTYKTNASGELVQQATIHTKESMEKGSTRTGQTFVASNGVKYDVYANNNTQRLFIIRESKTGNNYKQYLEEKQ